MLYIYIQAVRPNGLKDYLPMALRIYVQSTMGTSISLRTMDSILQAYLQFVNTKQTHRIFFPNENICPQVENLDFI